MYTSECTQSLQEEKSFLHQLINSYIIYTSRQFQMYIKEWRSEESKIRSNEMYVMSYIDLPGDHRDRLHIVKRLNSHRDLSCSYSKTIPRTVRVSHFAESTTFSSCSQQPDDETPAEQSTLVLLASIQIYYEINYTSNYNKWYIVYVNIFHGRYFYI